MEGQYTLRFFSDVIDWIKKLEQDDPESHDHVIAALERLQEMGPALRRPTVGAIEGSEYRNMRELRARSGSRVSIRFLFAFDPKRCAIFLVVGDKANNRQWAKWYKDAVREADSRYTAYLRAHEEERLWSCATCLNWSRRCPPKSGPA